MAGRAGDLPALRPLTTTFIDRGRKHPARALTSLLLGEPRVPFIVGDFRSSGQCLRSVRTLLDGAARRHERNAYVIGVPEEIFSEIGTRAKNAERPSRVQVEIEPENISPTAYLNLLDQEEVPAELTTKLVGDSPEMQLVRQLIVLASRCAATIKSAPAKVVDAAHWRSEPVLILGETGTGKEIAARAIHELSPERRVGGFKVLNCGAVSHELFETELFGYVPGAFTGALRRGKVGLWAEAKFGTLFLDEIGDLPLHDQVKILRVLEDGRIRPVGSTNEVRADARVIAATNRDLRAMVEAGEFRADLYYRLGPAIPMPRLRAHADDIPLLAGHFWTRLAPGRPTLSDELLEALKQYRWPGNARELRAVLTSLVTMFPRTRPRLEHLRAVFQMQGSARLDDDGLKPADDARVHRGECVHHLRRAEEAVHACRVLLRPFGSSPASNGRVIERVRVALARRLAELQVLETQPALFHSMSTLDSVHQAIGGLLTMQRLLSGNVEQARRHWKKELSREISGASSIITKEIGRLVRML